MPGIVISSIRKSGVKSSLGVNRITYLINSSNYIRGPFIIYTYGIVYNTPLTLIGIAPGTMALPR